MTNDLFESISQRGSVEETPENIRIHEIANELRRCCQLYEAQLRDSKENVDRFEIFFTKQPIHFMRLLALKVVQLCLFLSRD